MYIEKETEKALLMVHNAVPFWIQKRWYKNGKLAPAGWKSFREAEKKRLQHFSFNALKEFDIVRETEKAVLLCCQIECPNGPDTPTQFWLPKSMTHNYDFVAKKMRELEIEFPYVNGRVKWSGNVAA